MSFSNFNVPVTPPPKSSRLPFPSNRDLSRKRSLPKSSSPASRPRHTRQKSIAVPHGWVWSSSCSPSQSETTNALLPAAPVEPSTTRSSRSSSSAGSSVYATPSSASPGSESLMKRSPGLQNLNLFTQSILSEENQRQSQRDLAKWSLSSRQLESPPRGIYGHSSSLDNEVSSPELPDSPDTPYISDDEELDTSDAESEYSDVTASPCVVVQARRVRGPLQRYSRPELVQLSSLTMESVLQSQKMQQEKEVHIARPDGRRWSGMSIEGVEENLEGLGLGV
ncbi:hypothetical protein T439DRAFT_379101 [Meredithblackwellia eburnea MCA 4105]